MEVVRPIREDDFESLCTLVNQSGKGFYNLPKDPSFLKKRIHLSKEAFSEKPDSFYYQFVMEDTETKELIGTSAIQSTTNDPRCYYRIEEVQHPMRHPSNRFTLHPECYPDRSTEVCGLFLKKEAREKGLGRLLSLSRFLFIASYRSRFSEKIYAEMRGIIFQDGTFPFWEMFGRLFYNVPGEEANRIRIHQPDKVPEMLPNYPVYLCFLPQKVQSFLHETHVNTIPALSLLYEEGFQYENEIDIIDAGPKVIAKTESIRTIRNLRTAQVQEIRQESPLRRDHLICNAQLQFCSCYGSVEQLHEGVRIDRDAARNLQVSIGDQIRYIERK